MLAANPGQYIRLSPPSRHQRNPSMTPTMGLSEYKRRQFAGTTLELKPTGET